MKTKLSTRIATLGAVFILVVGATTAFAAEGDTTDETEKGGFGGQGRGNNYEVLVEEGLISEDTLEDIMEYLEENSEDMKADREEQKELLDEMTEEEREEYLAENEKSNPLEALVEEGLLTEDEAEAIAEFTEENGKGGNAKGRGGRPESEDTDDEA